MESDAAAKNLSIIITSYNQKSTLELLLKSLDRQTFTDFEVVVADDGSSDQTRELCAIPRGFKVSFVTQADQGYRKSKILNQAIRIARGSYLIFLDADVVLERHFVEDHLGLRAPGAFVCGRRVELGPVFTSTVTATQVEEGFFDRVSFSLIKSARNGDTQNLKRAIRIPSAAARRFLGYDKPIDILGSNFSAWKSDLVEVNGFNEALEAYWGEDGDLFIRLRNVGKKSRSAKGLCVQYHLFHKRREPSAENQARVSELLKRSDYKWATQGLT